MQLSISDNIRSFRKQRKLTQEQLAEVLGVTAGAVHKWESGLSVPELPMIVDLADFFDASVDALLGYEMKDNRLEATIRRLKQFGHEKERIGLLEAEKALKKYPNSFGVVHESAALYQRFGTVCKEKDLLMRSLELMEESILLLPQNTDPEIDALTIYGDMALVYVLLGQKQKAVELLKKNNAGGHYSDQIGLALVEDNTQYEEAVPYLSDALLIHVAALIRTILGFINVYLNRGDLDSAQAVTLWGIGILSGLRKEERPNLTDKVNSALYTVLAYTQLKSGNTEAARASLMTAEVIAESFDAAPDYDGRSVRFFDHSKPTSAYDNLGATALETVGNTLKSLEDEALSALWEEIVGQGGSRKEED